MHTSMKFYSTLIQECFIQRSSDHTPIRFCVWLPCQTGMPDLSMNPRALTRGGGCLFSPSLIQRLSESLFSYPVGKHPCAFHLHPPSLSKNLLIYGRLQLLGFPLPHLILNYTIIVFRCQVCASGEITHKSIAQLTPLDSLVTASANPLHIKPVFTGIALMMM